MRKLEIQKNTKLLLVLDRLGYGAKELQASSHGPARCELAKKYKKKKNLKISHMQLNMEKPRSGGSSDVAYDRAL